MSDTIAEVLARRTERSRKHVVMENHGPHKHTRIHEATCSFAKPRGHTTKHTRWFPLRPDGYFYSYKAALSLAQGLGQPNGVHLCRFCRPAPRKPIVTAAEIQARIKDALRMIES